MSGTVQGIAADGKGVGIARRCSKSLHLQHTQKSGLLLYCAKCGKRIGRTTNRGVPRLRCVNHRNCHTASCDYAKAEEQIITALRQ